MKKALFKSFNLVGDGLWISLAWKAWWEKNKAEYDTVDLLTLDDHVKRLYYGMGVPCNVKVDGRDSLKHVPYDKVHEFHVSNAFKLSDQKQQHLAESYADLLGVELDRKPDKSHLVPIYDPVSTLEYGTIMTKTSHIKPILISMFSASCVTRNPAGARKMLDWPKWIPILKKIRQTFPDNPIRFLGAPTDQLPFGWGAGTSSEEQMFGVPLDRLAHIMRECLFLLTLDNGMGHLAASQGSREFILYPAILHDYYILPFGNSNMCYLHQNPLTVNPAQIIWELQRAWQKWGLV